MGDSIERFGHVQEARIYLGVASGVFERRVFQQGDGQVSPMIGLVRELIIACSQVIGTATEQNRFEDF